VVTARVDFQRKGIGRERPATLNPNRGGVIEPNSFGTHEFLDFVDRPEVQGGTVTLTVEPRSVTVISVQP
jgi:hypothetical protein